MALYLFIHYFLSRSSACADCLRKWNFFSTVESNQPSDLRPLSLLSPAPCSPRTTVTSWAAGTTTRTGCTRRRRHRTVATTTTPTWTRWSPSRPPPTTALSRTASNLPPTTWTFTPACGGLHTGRSRTLARLTPGCRGRGRRGGRGGARKHTMNYFMNSGFIWVWLLYSECVCVCVCVLRGEFSWAMADGKMERVPKKEIKECWFFLPIVLAEEDGIWLGDALVFFCCCFVLFFWTIADDSVKTRRRTAVSRR